MYYPIQKTFENSLRGGNTDFSIASLKNKHKTCKGTLHATGNHHPKTTTNSSNPSSNSNNKLKSSSVSSEGFSESDSVDSLKDDANRKNSAICDRLHNAATKASYAKTAKMRYLEDGNDDDVVWIEDLNEKNKQPMAKKTVAIKNEPTNNFIRAAATRNSFNSRGSFRKTTPTTNGLAKITTPPTSNTINGNSRNSVFRSSGRRSVRVKKWKGGCISWEEAWFRANNRKVHCFGGDDKTNCFKDLNALLAAAKSEVSAFEA